jgi:hypothetical protein
MMYDFKNRDSIKYTEFCCEHHLTEEILTALQFTREYECIDLIADADVITEVLRTLLNVEIDGEMFTFGMVNIDGGEYDYCGEYTLSINDDKTIWIEPTIRYIDGKETLYDTEAYVTFLYGECDSKILQKLEKDKHNVVIFDFEDEYDEF